MFRFVGLARLDLEAAVAVNGAVFYSDLLDTRQRRCFGYHGLNERPNLFFPPFHFNHGIGAVIPHDSAQAEARREDVNVRAESHPLHNALNGDFAGG